MPKPRSAGRPEHSRQLPPDNLLQSSETELASQNIEALRSVALQQAPTPAAPSELHRMWIPCPNAVKKKHLCDVLDELAKDDQPQAWKDARQARLLQDFKLIPNTGIRFTCSSYSTATKLSLVKLNAFGSQIQIARFSRYGSRYFIDLVRLPDEVTDHMIFDWFAGNGAPPTCILPTYVRNGLPSRERTVYFGQDQPPQVLVPTETQPLREIQFPSPDGDTCLLRPAFVNHKVSRYNRVTPPSILLRQAEERARQEFLAAAETAVEPPTPTSSTSEKTSGRFVSSLQQSIRLAKNTGQVRDTESEPSDDRMSCTNSAPDTEEAGSDSDGTRPDFREFLEETVETPKPKPDAPLWAKTAANRRAIVESPGSASVYVNSLKYAFDKIQGTAQAADITRANYYSPLWYDDLDPDNPSWHFDVEIRHDETDEACVESPPPNIDRAKYLELMKSETLTYDVEEMTRMELYAYIQIYLDNIGTRSPLDQLALVEANPGIMLKAIGTKDRLDDLALNRAMCRLLANAPRDKSTERKACLKLLRKTGDRGAMLEQLLRFAGEQSDTATEALVTLSAWDVVLHIMAPTVYQDPMKLDFLNGENPQFLTNLPIPLLSDYTLWLVGFSPFATGLLHYDEVPAFLKNLISSVQAIKPTENKVLTPRLHF